MNAFHARGPLHGAGPRRGPVRHRVRGQLRGSRGQRHSLRGHASRHRQPRRRRRAPSKPADNGPKLLLHGDWREAALAAGRALHRGDSADFSAAPQGKYRLEGLWPYALTRQRRPVRAAARSDDRRRARRAAQGSPADRRARSRRLRRQRAARRRGPLESRGKLVAGRRREGIQSRRAAARIQRRARLQPEGERRTFDGDGMLDVAFSDLSGKLRGNTATRQRPRRLKHGEDWTFDKLRLRAGTTRLAIDGNSARRASSNLDFSLDADNLGAAGRRRARHSCMRAAGSRGTVGRAGHQARRAGRGHRASATLKHRQALRERRRRLARPARLACRHRASRGSTFDERELTQFNAVLDGTTAEHTFKRRRARRPGPACTCRARAAFNDGVWNGTIGDLFIDDTANINLQLDTPVARHGERQGLQARRAVPARQGGAPVRRRRLERGRLERARRCAQPADQHAHRRTHAATSNTRAPSMPPQTCAAAAARRSSARRAPTWSTPRSATSSPAAAPTSSVSARVSSR